MIDDDFNENDDDALNDNEECSPLAVEKISQIEKWQKFSYQLDNLSKAELSKIRNTIKNFDEKRVFRNFVEFKEYILFSYVS